MQWIIYFDLYWFMLIIFTLILRIMLLCPWYVLSHCKKINNFTSLNQRKNKLKKRKKPFGNFISPLLIMFYSTKAKIKVWMINGFLSWRIHSRPFSQFLQDKWGICDFSKILNVVRKCVLVNVNGVFFFAI